MVSFITVIPLQPFQSHQKPVSHFLAVNPLICPVSHVLLWIYRVLMQLQICSCSQAVRLDIVDIVVARLWSWADTHRVISYDDSYVPQLKLFPETKRILDQTNQTPLCHHAPAKIATPELFPETKQKLVPDLKWLSWLDHIKWNTFEEDPEQTLVSHPP